MPFKTRYGSHYHMTEGCHGATIPCGTEGLTPCSDCCGSGASTGGGTIAGLPSVTETSGRLAYEDLDTFATDGVAVTLSAETLSGVREEGDLESYLAMATCASTEVAIDDVSEVSRNPDGSVTFHVRGEYMGTEDDYREVDDDGEESPTDSQSVAEVVAKGIRGFSEGMPAPDATVDPQGMEDALRHLSGEAGDAGRQEGSDFARIPTVRHISQLRTLGRFEGRVGDEYMVSVRDYEEGNRTNVTLRMSPYVSPRDGQRLMHVRWSDDYWDKSDYFFVPLDGDGSIGSVTSYDEYEARRGQGVLRGMGMTDDDLRRVLGEASDSFL